MSQPRQLKPSLGDLLSIPALMRREWWSEERLRLHQEQRLRALVKQAYEQVPFYRALWQQAGIVPTDIRTLDDLGRLPVTPYRTFKSTPTEELVARNIPPQSCCTERSSGSNGQPLSLRYRYIDRFVLLKAMAFRFYRAWSVGLTDRLAGFSPHRERLNVRSWYERLGLWRRLTLFACDDPEQWIAPLAKWNPDVLSASPMTLRVLAPLLRESGVCLRPRVVFSSGARLESYDREEFSELFATRITDVYGCWEGGFLAWQCPVCPGYHVNSDTAILEVLDPEGRPCRPGKTGEAVITNLYSAAMPFIRYNIGDVIEPSSETPRCGRNLPLIAGIWGRNNDVVHLPSGDIVGPYKLMAVMAGFKEVREWRIEQQNDGTCEAIIVPRAGVEIPTERYCQEMGAIFRNEIPVRVKLVDHIERPAQTKWKSIVSHVTCRKAAEESLCPPPACKPWE